MGRRMAEGAALLVDHVLPPVGYRQWVLSFSGPLAVRLGYDRELLAAVSERRRGCRGGHRPPSWRTPASLPALQPRDRRRLLSKYA